MQEGDLMAKLLEAFREEARERLETLYSFVEALEQGSIAAEKLDEAYREAHSLKGAARAVGLVDVVQVCQELESFINGLKDESGNVNRELTDRLYHFIREIESKIYAGMEGDEHPAEMAGISAETPITEGTSEVETFSADNDISFSTAEDKPEEQAKSCPFPIYEPAETIRVNVRRLDVLLRRAEELISIKLASSQQTKELKRLYWFVEDVKNRRGDDPDLSYIENILHRLARQMESTSRQLDFLVEDLMDRAKDVLLQPFSVLFQGMGRMVKELASDLGKEVVLTVDGEDIEIDRRILDELRSPIIHLLRNAVDHGIESPEERIRQGKERQGRISVTIKREEARKIFLILRDDGRGISLERVRQKVIDLGLASPSEVETMDKGQLLHFIFSPGFSTSSAVTELSGRGIGMSIVKEKIEAVGGTVSVYAEEGRGTEFVIALPVSLATFRGILVKDLGRRFMVSTHSVEALIRLGEAEREIIMAGGSSIKFQDRVIPLQRLGLLLGLGKSAAEDIKDPSVALIISASGGLAAFLVEEVITEQEGLIKGLGPHLKRVPFVWAATILGTGEVVPVLNPGDLVRSFQHRPMERKDADGYSERRMPEKRNILVVEDSITSRTLLKNILEAAGYSVMTAIDGLEALSLLEEFRADLVISDVEMPRMDGIELTRRIRASEKTRNLPVILVTGLDSPEDRRRGLDAGADAYIVKTDFRQTKLLDMVKRYL